MSRFFFRLNICFGIIVLGTYTLFSPVIGLSDNTVENGDLLDASSGLLPDGWHSAKRSGIPSTEAYAQSSRILTDDSKVWVYSATYRSSYGCSGTPIAASGSLANKCLPSWYDGSIVGYYLFKQADDCSGTPKYLFWNSTVSTTCDTTLVHSTTELPTGCSEITNSASGEVRYENTNRCGITTGTDLPISWQGSVVQTSYDTCGTGKPIFFSATSTTTCQVKQSDAYNPYYALYMGSTMSNCTAEGVPMTVGYLGPHCSTVTTETALSQTCANKSFWDSNSLYQNVQYSCSSAPSKVNDFVGWIYAESFNSQGCVGTPMQVSGTAIGPCYVGYDSNNDIMGSATFSCTGYTAWASENCTGVPAYNSSTNYQKSLNQCIQSRHHRYGRAIQSSISYCSLSTQVPVSGGNWLVQQQYDNEVCEDIPVAFTAYPLNTQVATNFGNTSYYCDGSQPKMYASINSAGITDYTQYLVAGCSYVNPAYTSQLRRYNSQPIQYSSYSYTGCSSTSQGDVKDDGKLPPGSAAAVAMAVLLFVSVVASGLYCLLFDGSCTRPRYSYGRGATGGLLQTTAAARNKADDDDDIQLTGVHATI